MYKAEVGREVRGSERWADRGGMKKGRKVEAGEIAEEEIPGKGKE